MSVHTMHRYTYMYMRMLLLYMYMYMVTSQYYICILHNRKYTFIHVGRGNPKAFSRSIAVMILK